MLPTLENVIEDVNLENDVVQLLVTEAVRTGLETPLREPILEAVEGTGDEFSDESTAVPSEAQPTDGTAADTSDTGGKSRLTMALQGLAVFVVLFVALYVTLRFLMGDDEA